jgi:TolB-like protein/DNA-binding winged helix-turn-helix (wHTH) protein/Flp pilus assembly protein TadD
LSGLAAANMEAVVDKRTYRFRDFELDLGAHRLRLRGEPVRLERRPLQLLVLLVTRHGLLVSREEIIGHLWPGKVVIDFETGINTLVRKVRHALGDSPDDAVFIETVAGLGYRFIAPLEPDAIPNTVQEQPAAAITKSAELPTQLVETLTRPAQVQKNPALRSRAVAILLLAISVATISVWQSRPTEPEQTRIAVFPFENLTGNDDLSYLASGIAEETSTSLAQIDLSNLTVIGSVSTRALADSGVSLRKAGSELGVDYIVTSSLRLGDSRIRVTSRLIRIADDAQIWSASFDRELINVLGLQRELSIAIAEQIRQRLSPEVAAAIDRRQTRNPEAYELYLKGRFEWMRFQPDSIPFAIQYYQQAVARDPTYALAWAGIAHALITSTVTVEADRESILPAAQDALQRALEYGPNLAETQLALGSFHLFLDRNLPPAEAAARQAISLDPNSAMSHMFLGIVLSERGKHVEARAMLRRARELDPLFPLMFANSANVSLEAGEPQEALEFATQAIAINPEFWVGYLYLGTARLALGDYEAAAQAFSSAEKISGGNAVGAVSSRAYALARLGREDEARGLLVELMSLASNRHVSPYSIAVVHAGLDERDAAFEWLARASAAGDIGCFSFANDPALESLRTDLRFEALLKQCGITP